MLHAQKTDNFKASKKTRKREKTANTYLCQLLRNHIPHAPALVLCTDTHSRQHNNRVLTRRQQRANRNTVLNRQQTHAVLLVLRQGTEHGNNLYQRAIKLRRGASKRERVGKSVCVRESEVEQERERENK